MNGSSDVLSHPSIRFIPDGGVLSLDQVAVGIITALPQENAVVCELLGCNRNVVANREGGDKVYRLGVVREKGGQRGIVVAVALLNSMGNVSAATRVTHMVNDCPVIQEIIVCGIAGAVPNPAKADDHVRLGDIVVSDDVLEYDFGKQLPGGFQITSRVYPASNRLTATARSLQSDELVGQRPWEGYIDLGLQTLGSQFARPPVSTDVLNDGNWNPPRGFRAKIFENILQWFRIRPSYQQMQHPNDPIRNQNPERPRIFHGLIASASSVLKNPEVRERLRTDHNAIGVEMETFGAAHAAYTGNVPYFMVRGTCDYCNPVKNSQWQPYAALVAAAYTRALLEATNLNVFAGSQKILIVVSPEIGNLELQEDIRPPVLSEDIQRALVETKAAAEISGDLPMLNIDIPSSRTSEAVREIPRLATESEQSSAKIDLAGLLQSDLVVTESGRRFGPIIAVTEPTIHTHEQETPKGRDAQLSERERSLISSEGERQLNNLKELLEKWEYNSAFAAAVAVADWMVENELCISSILASEIFEMLARIEAVRTQRNAERGEPIELTRARYFLGKAKDARSR